jgi:hypothetical protein
MSTGTTVSFTLGCWVYFTSLPSNEVALLGKGNGSLANATEYCLLRHHPNNRFAILVSSGSVEQRLEYTALTPSINTWYFVVAWYDHVNDILGMSVNDGTPATMSYSAGLFDSAQPFEVGRFPSYAGEYLPGRVDNILFYKRVLTATEITAWYNSGTGQDYPPTADTPVGMLTPQAASDMLVLGSSPETPSGMANGALRWSGTDFEGRKGGAWVSLVGGTMATQNADAVAITGGAISLGGHAPTGVLDVQGSVVASDAANSYFGARLWPVAPSGATEVNGLRVESVTGAASATATHKGVVVRDMPVTSGQVMGMDSRISAGANRYNIYAIGTAANYFAGTVGIQATPASDSALFLQWARATQHGIHLRPTDSDSGGNPAIRFVNMAYGVVGSITTNATATAYNTSSDHRLKRSIQALLGGVEAMQRMRPVSFVWQSTDEPDIGFLAHELMTVAPNAVQGLPDEVNLDGSIKPQQVDQSKLIPILVAAIKELVARVEVLEQALGV